MKVRGATWVLKTCVCVCVYALVLVHTVYVCMHDYHAKDFDIKFFLVVLQKR